MNYSAFGKKLLAAAMALALIFALASLAPAGTLPSMQASAAGTAVTVTGSVVNLRSGPGTGYSVVGSVTKGSSYAIVSTGTASNGDVWYKIQYGSSQVWICGAYIKLAETPDVASPPAASPPVDPSGSSYVTVISAPANIRSGAGTSFTKLGAASLGATFPLLGSVRGADNNTWYKVTYSGREAWMLGTLVRVTPGGAAAPSAPSSFAETPISGVMLTVKVAAINVRSGPGTEYTVLSTLDAGASFEIASRAAALNGDIWYKFSWGGSYVWICGNYITMSNIGTAPTNPTTPTTAPTAAPTAAPTVAPTTPTAPLPGSLPNYITRTITINVAQATVHAAAGSNNPILGYVYEGQSFVVTEWESDGVDITWFKFNLNGQDVWISRLYTAITNSLGTIPNRVFSASRPPVIYLSPSRQTGNPYAYGGTNEYVEMERVATYLKAMLESKYRCTVYMPPQSMLISFRNRPMDAYNKGADIYLAIHSNAGQGYGAEAYTYPACAQSVALGQNIVSAMGRVTAGKLPPSTVVSPVKNGMEYFNNIGYGEVRDPSHLGMIAVLAEVEFHDKPDSAKWIIEYGGQIASALCDALDQTFSFPAR